MAYQGKKHYMRVINPKEEARLNILISTLQGMGLHFYTLSERCEGDARYVDVKISIKLS